MTIPFLHLFKRGPKTAAAVAEPPPPLVATKPESERLSKTVLPSAVRPPGENGEGRAQESRGIPPAVALALEPRVERVLSLPLSEIHPLFPEGVAKPIESLDRKRPVLFKAAEVEKGMAAGKPEASLASIHRQMPEVFLRTIAPTDPTMIVLPFQKVLEAFSHMKIRRDQVRDQMVPQVETPFLNVTLEDNKRFGLPNEPIETSDMPPVCLEPATAESIAKAQPESAAAALKVKAPSVPAAPRRVSLVDPPAAPTRIAFQIPPNGTGVSAPEIVPASSGPSVPTVDSKAAAGGPARIPFKIAAPSEAARPRADAAGPAPVALTPAPKDDRKITLSLRAVLENLLEFQRKGDPGTVPAEARFEIGLALVEPQLVTGKISVSPEVFAAGLPAEYREYFVAEDNSAPVMLPLQEVLINLPSATLKMRDDQEESVQGETFATPFSAAAEEDAKRFSGGGAPAAPAPKVEKPSLPAAPAPVPPARETPPMLTASPTQPVVAKEPALPVLAEKKPSTEPVPKATPAPAPKTEGLDAKAVVAKASGLAGVKACAISFADGLSLAGNLPDELEAEGLCAMAPTLLQKVATHMVATRFGEFQAMTLHGASSTVSFFMHGNICLAALHAAGELATGIREELATMVKELSAIYSQPETAHVHH